jgi:hypothetical protein
MHFFMTVPVFTASPDICGTLIPAGIERST